MASGAPYEIETSIRNRLYRGERGLDVARSISQQFHIPLDRACREVSRLQLAHLRNVGTPERRQLFAVSSHLPAPKHLMVFGDLHAEIRARLSTDWSSSISVHVARPGTIDPGTTRDGANMQFEADPLFLARALGDAAAAAHFNLFVVGMDAPPEVIAALRRACSSNQALLFSGLYPGSELRRRFVDEGRGKAILHGEFGSWQPPDSPLAAPDPMIESMKRTLMDSPSAFQGKTFADALKVLDGSERWPERALTMIGRVRLEALQDCVWQILADNVPGDFVETGVWRGGASIFMRALLRHHGELTRRVWVADSFAGLPPPNPERYPADKGLNFEAYEELSVSLDDVRAGFETFGLNDAQVVFLQGWFSDTLPHAPIKQLSLLRLDGDLYESTIDALVNLYPKLARGGFVIIDDYGALSACRQAVEDYRREHQIDDPIQGIDWTGVYWRKT